MDPSQPFGAFTALTGVGYKVRQKPADSTLKNNYLASLGGAYKFNSDTSLELIYDYRAPVAIGSGHAAELTATVYHKLSKDWRISTYVLKGFTDESADYGAGVLIARRF